MTTPDWIDREEYPFESNYLELDGGRMHYIDEGEGEPIVMVHGNPSWSFLYRHMIKGLSKKFRCIAPDHLGFGLSDKPYELSYLPEGHAKNIETLIERLELKNVTLVGQDWGGPTGFSYAANNPENVKSLIVLNTWMWSVKGDLYYEAFSRFMGGAIGRFLIKRYNYFVNGVMKIASGDKSKLNEHVHNHYRKPLEKPEDRKACWAMPKRIVGSSEWLDELWSQREKIKDKPALILWGMKDIAFREKELKKWSDLFTNREVVKFEDAGHFLQEEKGGELVPYIEEFLEKNK